MAGWFDEAVTIGVDGVVSAIDQKQISSTTGAAVTAGGYAPPPSAAHRPQSVPAAASTSGRSTPDIFGFVLLLLYLGVPALLIAVVIREIARNRGPGSLLRDSKWFRRGRVGIGTGVALSGTDWSNQESNDSSSMNSSTMGWVDSTSSSSWTDSSGSCFGDSSSSYSDSSSSGSFSDSGSGSSGSDFGGGGSTDSW
jgi:hypothetical protein